MTCALTLIDLSSGNATALAAIERIKANKQRADAALAELNRSPDQQTASLSSDSSSNGGAQSASALAKGQGADSLVPLTPAMKQQKKVAHNAIERRYRNNINDRIAQLRNAVPALRHLRPKKTASSRKSRKAGGPDELVDGVAAATKLNKATILGKATEYIKYLKGRELRLVAEVTGLRELVRSLEGGEELLELWEGEMERVVLEQEAAAAKEEEEQAAAEPLDDDDLNGVADGDDGDDDDEQEQSFESHQNGRWPTKQESPPATYGAGVRYPYSPSSDHSANGNGNAAGGAQRYLMAMFLGFTFLGSGAEIATDSAASDATSAIEPSSHGIVRAAGGRVIGAGHQLLKRAAASSLASPRVGAPQPHHLDHVPSHLLAFELLRAASFVACLAFVLWPLFARFTRRRDPAHVQARQAKTEEEHARRRKTTLAALARTQQEPENLDQALRAFVNAPGHWFTSALALVQQTAIMGAQNVLGRPLIKGPAPGSVARELEREKAAVWMRLLEVETALGARAQRSFIARVHTLLRVQNLRLDDQGPVDAITSPARVNATTALALNRLGATTPLAPLVNGLAQDFWARGRRALLLAAAEEEEDVEDADEDADFSPISDGTSSAWIHGSLRLSLDQACERTPTPQMVVEALSQPDTSARMCLSPLLGLADAQVTGALGLIWTRLFPALVDALCPSIDIAKSKALDLSSLNFDMDLVRDPSRRDGLSRECARLVRAAPSGTRSKVLAHTTLATWALMLGRTRLARTLATELATPNGSAMSAAAAHSASAFSLVRLVLGPAAANACLPVAVGEVGGRKPRAEDEVDALAATALGWLGFLRLFANSKSKTDEEKSSASSSTALVEAALSLRRLLAHPVPAIRHAYTSGHLNSVDLVARANADTGEGARIDSASESAAADAEMEAEAAETVLEEAKDRLTDVLALIGRRAARAAAGWKDEESDSDSGVDFASAT